MRRDGADAFSTRVEELADRLPDALAPLAAIALDYAWSWTPGGREVFRSLDRERFSRWRENPVLLLRHVPRARLEALANDDVFVSQVEALGGRLQAAREAPVAAIAGADADHPVAFLCAEFAIHSSLHIYSGGLGVLAGDILKEASDRRLPFVGVGLWYHQGNVRQRIDARGIQEDFWVDQDPELLPAVRVRGDDGSPLLVTVPIGGRDVRVQIWRVQVGRVPLFLLDANRPENDVSDRWITSRLYVGDPDTRLEQYALLGVGVIRALEAMGVDPGVIHLNEGHAVFAPLERARRAVETGADVDDALARAASRTVFTTHTPVPAGNEERPLDDVQRVLGAPFDGWGARLATIGVRPGRPGTFGMTTAGLRLSARATAVSAVHERVSREMWAPLFPDATIEEVPIDHVTNGVHLPTWMAPPVRDLFDRYLGGGWTDRADDPTTWDGVEDIPDQDLWAVRSGLRADLVRWIHDHDVRSRLRRSESRSVVEAATGAFDPERLTLGFARRVATYKRLPLLWHDGDRLQALLEDPRGIQIVIAGKAHPKDTEAKAALAELFSLPWASSLAARVSFVEDYDMATAVRLVAGCDVWLNLPRPPQEASGTSGMKSALNGGLHVSVIDGWWAEGYDGTNGWAVGDLDPFGDPERRDERDAASLYDLLEGELRDTFLDRDAARVPHAWVHTVKRSLMTLGPRFNATRMVDEYARRIYPG